MTHKRLLVAIVLLAASGVAGCSKPKPVAVITGDASTRTPDSPAVTGGRNVFIYEGRHQPESPSLGKRKWIIKADPSPFIKEEDWMCLSTGRIDDAQIVLGSDKIWTVYSHGAKYGEFIDRELARKQAEKIPYLKNLECD